MPARYRSVADFGAGLGQYGKALRQLDPRHRYTGYDGAGNSALMTDGFVRFADLGLPLALPRAHWVLSLEAGEHVPREREGMLLRNIHAHNCVGVIVTWATINQWGDGHVNTHDPPYLISIFEELGYVRDVALSERMANVSRTSLFVMRRKRRLPHCDS